MGMIGVIGLGRMGAPIARRLLGRGIEVVVHDTDRAALGLLAAAGAATVHSPLDVANRAEVVFACLPSAEQCFTVARQVAAGNTVEIYTELSTIGRHAMRQLGEILRPAQVELVDAPIMGSPATAENGTLSMLLSGPSAARARVAEIAESFADRIVAVGGEPGLAQLCKLVNDGIGLTALIVSCEAILAGVGNGIDASVLVEVINAGTGRNTATTDRIPNTILPRTFDSGESLGSALKDLDLYLQEATAAGIPEGVITGARAICAKATQLAGAAPDASTVIRYLESSCGFEV